MELDLFKIAYLSQKPLDYAIKNFDTKCTETRDLSAKLREIYKNNPESFKEYKIYNKPTAELPTGFLTQNGNEIVAIFVENKNSNRDKDQRWALVSIEEKTKDLLYEFAICDGFNPKFKKGTEKLNNLAKMALEEDWGKDNIALVKYIQYTFHYLRSNEPEKIVEENKFAAFNTGLVSKGLWNDIYALFEKVENPKDGMPQYKLRSFCHEGVDDGNIMSEFFTKFPAKASYFNRNNASEVLIFDPLLEIHPNLKHIIFDGLKRNRFPKEFLKSLSISDQDVFEIINSENFDDARIKVFAERLDRAIKHAQKRIKQNYKIAIPMYFPTKNVMSFLLPIVLGDNLDGEVDVALTASLTPAGRYIAQTVLTLPMAYANSRLVCKPSNEWLEINKDSDIAEDQ